MKKYRTPMMLTGFMSSLLPILFVCASSELRGAEKKQHYKCIPVNEGICKNSGNGYCATIRPGGGGAGDTCVGDEECGYCDTSAVSYQWICILASGSSCYTTGNTENVCTAASPNYMRGTCKNLSMDESVYVCECVNAAVISPCSPPTLYVECTTAP